MRENVGSPPDPRGNGVDGIAVIGIACRLPGAPDADAFRTLVREGRSAVAPQPDGTWRAALEDPAGFDAAFFGMGPAEAAATDPQHRLVLEAAWTALEDAGVAPDGLAGSDSGVFVGIASDDYATLVRRAGAVGAHSSAGLHRAMAANQLSYRLGLRGPSLAVDTAQSSSLTAVHLAVESLRGGRSSLAIAAGVHLVLAPEGTETLEAMGALSPDGAIRPLDARANGFVRGEGVVALVLKPLRQAQADGDRVHAVITGTAVNNDGGGPGLTTPDADAQEALIRAAWADAGSSPSEAGYFELHGTGTPAGDPVEAAALGAALGTPGAAVPVGSVKANVGHLEAAAGITGLLKAVLCVRDGIVVPLAGFTRSDIPLADLGLAVPTEAAPWVSRGPARLAGVSSFGMGGSNVHVVISSPPAVDRPVGTAGLSPVALSARDEPALRDSARRLALWVREHPGTSLDDVATTGVRRTVRGPRAVVVAGTADELVAGLADVASGEAAVTGDGVAPGRVVFVYPGQGAQWVRMGADLAEASPVFAEALGECGTALAEFTDWDLGEVLRSGAEDALARVDVVQPASWAVMVALTAQWRAAGVTPDAVLGHSQGEIAAAVVSGALSLRDGARVVALRSQVIARSLAGAGGMASVALPADQVRSRLGDGLEVAAVNSPTSTVVSGDAGAVAAFVAAAEAEGLRARVIPVDYASHSAQVERIEAELAAVLGGVPSTRPDVPFLSTVTGEWVSDGLDAAYWYRSLRQPVRFAAAVETLLGDGFGVFLESSPHPVLTTAVAETADAADRDVVTLASLSRSDGGPARWLTSLGAAWSAGLPVLLPTSGAVVSLPAYPFRRVRHWVEDAAPAPAPIENGSRGESALPVPEPAVPETFSSGTASGDRRAELLERVLRLAAKARGDDDAPPLGDSRTFKDQGFSSVNVVELRNRLSRELGRRLPTALVYDHPTPALLTDHLLTLLPAPPAAIPAPAEVPVAEVPVGAPAPVATPAEDLVVIVGMACRFAGGVASPEDLWKVLADEADVVSGFPADRGWDLAALYHPEPGQAGRTYAREGGFLHEAAEFDAAFFGISPREAEAMDPQQRLLLETSWEALERGGLDPHDLAGSRTGVFTGVMTQQYGPKLHRAGAQSEGYLLTGTSASVASGRIAYALGLEGPAVSVDTACSSSLVALHLAAQALRAGECDLALAGGVTVMATPGIFVEFSRQRGLAADGRCKPFADAADGTGWAEGAGMLALERRSDAQRLGHPVLAVLRGSAVNQDGASNGLTAPSGRSQEAVVREALRAAGLGVGDVDAVEAHGTGTKLGDPIEAEALLATYGTREGGAPLYLGSLKSNLGHTQAAAGVAGVIKTVLSLRHGVLPRSLHVDEPSRHVDWSSGAVELLTQARDWPDAGRPRRGAVSSFGISGTNAHVILEQGPASTSTDPVSTTTPASAGPVAVPLSAGTATALRESAARWGDWLAGHPEATTTAVAATAARRPVFEHRALLVADDTPALAAALGDLAAGEPGAARVAGAPARTVFVFPGQGAQWRRMGVELAEGWPAFAQALTEAGAALSRFVDWDLLEVLREGDEETFARVDVVQPASWAVNVALAAAWRSAGVEPDAVIGHSQGEIAAAVVAGALTLEDGARVVALRSQVIARELAGLGGMASIALPPAEVEDLLAAPEWSGRLGVAAVNSPSATVVSGDADAVPEFVAAGEARGFRARVIPVDYASHSAHVERIEAALGEALEGLTSSAPRIPFLSTVSGERLGEGDLGAGYWYRNLRTTVRFADAVRTLLEQGFGAFVEVSAHPVLTMAITETAEAIETEVLALASLRRDDGGATRFLTSLGEAWTTGLAVDWATLAGPAEPLDLPTYPFQRQHFWLDDESAETSGRSDDLKSPVSRLDHAITWRQLPRPTGRPTGRWLVAGPADAEELNALREARVDVTAVDLGSGSARDDVATRLRDAGAAEAAGLVVLAGTGTGSSAAADVLALVQGAHDADLAGRVHVITRGAVAVAAGEVPGVAGAEVWGLGRVAALELPDLWGGLVDLPAEPDPRSLALLAGALNTDEEDQVAVRPSGVHGRRVERVMAPVTSPSPAGPAWQPRGTALITGGTGAIGAAVAKHLAVNGVEHLVLAGRRGPDAPGAAELKAELEALGPRVTLAAVDVTDRAAVEALLAEHPPTSVFHTAGLLRDALLDGIGAQDLADARAPKAGAAELLTELLDELTGDLDAFVLFSSVTGTWGNAGQGAYAAANAALDALAQRRRAQGLPATSIAWGPWAGGGMAEGTGEANLARQGLRAMDPAVAVEALQRALDRDDTGVTVIDVDWDRFAALRPGPLFSALPEAQDAARAAAPDDASDGDDAGSWPARFARASGAERRHTMLELVRTEAARLLGHADASGIAPDRAFKAAGLDSLTALELRNRLVAATGVKLTTTSVFDHPDPAALSAHLLDRIAPADEAATTEAEGTAEVTGAAEPAEHAVEGDPVVIVGMACRYPGGASTPEELWRIAAEERDVVGDTPTDRGWDFEALYDPEPGTPGKTYARQGGFLHGAGEFDAAFFGISPREALAMDPQQRLLLETSWEALERAGLDPKRLRGSRTGVYAGLTHQDYGPRLHEGVEEHEGYLLTGKSASVVSGRVAYALGLEGPAVSVDTACSSSLVTLHLAAQALRAGECDLALAGGVTLMSSPGLFVEFARQRGLSADGRCRSFDDAADGTGWAEGAGMVLLERLSDARRNGHEVLAVVAGSAINQDGASNGLTAPNGPSQERVIRAALAAAGLGVGDVDAVEAHGTGTKLGDPIEANALLATYGTRSGGDPLYLGSLKANVGHTQAAAGVAGVIKSVLAMRHGVLPRSLHVDRPTSHVDWAGGAVEVLRESRPWPAVGRPRRVGVSAFGVSGTNAHVVLEQPPTPDDDAPVPGPPVLPAAVTLSGRTAAALRESAARLGSWVAEHPEAAPADVAAATATRSAFEHRALLVVPDGSLAPALAALAAGESGAVEGNGEAVAGVVTRVARTAGRTAFVFPGQGAQWLRMGVELAQEWPAFASALEDAARALGAFVDWDLLEVLREGDEETFARVDVVQPASWAVNVALAAAWRSAGVEPDAVIGHSQGEIAAAVVAGALTLADGARVVALRSQVIARELAGLGGMASIALPRADVEKRLDEPGWAGRLGVAAVNSPSATVVSGDADAIGEFAAACEADQVRARVIPVDYASHGAHVERIEAELARVLGEVPSARPHLTFLSTVTGAAVEREGELNAGYWYRNLRQPVRFAEGVGALLELGFGAFVEASAHPVLTMAVGETAEDEGRDVVAVGSLRRGEGGRTRFLTSLGEAWTAGLPVDRESLAPSRGAALSLPTYPFQRETFWTPTSPAGLGPDAAARFGLAWEDHPFLSGATPLAGTEEVLLSGRVSLVEQPWLAGHSLLGGVLLPGTAFVELALRAADGGAVEELELRAPLAVPRAGGVAVQLRVGEPADGHRSITISSAGADGTWTLHAEGTLLDASVASADSPAAPTAGWAQTWPPAAVEGVAVEEVSVDEVQARFAEAGYGYDEAFLGLTGVWRRGEETFAEVHLPAAATGDFALHPALLDAALQPWMAGGLLDRPDGSVLLPFAWRGISLHATGATSLRVRLTRSGENGLALEAVDPSGAPVLTLDALTMRPLDAAALPALLGTGGAQLHEVTWLAVPGSGATDDPAAVELFPVEGGLDVDAGRVHAVTADVLERLQGWLAEPGEERPLVVLTSGAVAAAADEDVTDLAAAAVWGLVRSARAEHPGRFLLLDVGPRSLTGLRDDPVTAEAIGRLLAAGETEGAWRDGELRVPRLTVAGASAPEQRRDRDLTALADGTVLVTGATGTLGTLVAEHLVTEHGVRSLLLLGRRGADAPGAGEFVARLRELGAEPLLLACDAADREALARALEQVPGDRPLKAVVHAAGVLDDGALDLQDADRLAEVQRPKVAAALNLHELTRDHPVEAFVLFSGAAGVLGRPGQSTYASANTFLDALAHHRRAQGLPAVSLAWGLWDEATGMTGHLADRDRARMRRSGLAPMGTAEGLELFDRALATDGNPLLVPVRFDLAPLKAEQTRHGRAAVPALMHELVPAPPAARPAARRAAGRASGRAEPDVLDRDRLAGLEPRARDRELLRLVRGEVARVLGQADAERIEAQGAFRDIGFDSLLAVELRNRLAAVTGLRLPAALVFDHPTPRAVAAHLATVLVPATTPEETAAVPDALAAEPAAEPSAGPAAEVLAEPDPEGPDLTRLDTADDDDFFAFIEEQL